MTSAKRGKRTDDTAPDAPSKDEPDAQPVDDGGLVIPPGTPDPEPGVIEPPADPDADEPTPDPDPPSLQGAVSIPDQGQPNTPLAADAVVVVEPGTDLVKVRAEANVLGLQVGSEHTIVRTDIIQNHIDKHLLTVVE